MFYKQNIHCFIKSDIIVLQNMTNPLMIMMIMMIDRKKTHEQDSPMLELSHRARAEELTLQVGLSVEASARSHTLSDTTSGHVDRYTLITRYTAQVISIDSVTWHSDVYAFTHSNVLLRKLEGTARWNSISFCQTSQLSNLTSNRLQLLIIMSFYVSVVWYRMCYP